MSGFSALMFFMTLLCYDDVTNPRLHSLVILVTYFGKQIFTIVDRIPFAIVASEGSIEVEKIQSIFTASLLYFSIAVIYYLISKIFGHFGRRELVTNARRISERGSLLGLIAFSAAGVFGDYTVLGGSVLTVSENSHPRLYGWLHSLCLDAICFAASDLATIWAATCFGLMIFVFPLFAITGMLAALRKIRQI